MADDLHIIINYFETHNNKVTENELKEKLGFNDYSIRHRKARGDFLLLDKNTYSLTDKFYKKITVTLPGVTLRLDKQTFAFDPGMQRVVAEDLVKSKLMWLAERDNLLVKGINMDGNRYAFDFLPARFSKIDNHLVYDWIANSPEKSITLARTWEGYSRRFPLGQYFRYVAALSSEDYFASVAEVTPFLNKRFGEIGRLEKLSLNHHYINPVSLKSGTKTDIPDVSFDSKSSTYIFGKSYQDLAESQYNSKIIDTFQKLGVDTKRIVSKTFTKKILPGIGIGLSVHEIAHAKDKVDKAIEEATITAGGFTGGVSAAILLATTGPIGMGMAALMGGMAGSQFAEASYHGMRDLQHRYLDTDPWTDLESSVISERESSWLDYPIAAAKGIGDAAESIVDATVHPVDSMLSIFEFGVDYSVWLANYDVPETVKTLLPFGTLGQLLMLNPNRDTQGMERRVTAIQEGINQFPEASHLEQTRIISQLISSAVIPGIFIKAVKLANNKFHYDQITSPPLFYQAVFDNNNPTLVSAPLRLSLADIRNQKGLKAYSYVINQHHELIIAEFTQSELYSGMKFKFSNHAELARGGPVYDAGTLIVNNGKIIQNGIINLSDYLTWGSHLEKYTPSIFRRYGYAEVSSEKFTYMLVGEAGKHWYEAPGNTRYAAIGRRLEKGEIVRPIMEKVGDHPNNYLAAGLAGEATMLNDQNAATEHDAHSYFKFEFPSFIHQSKASELQEEQNTQNNMHEAEEFVPIPPELSRFTDEIDELISRHGEAELSPSEAHYSQEFLKSLNLPLELSRDPRENRAMLKLLSNKLIWQAQAAIQQDAHAKIKAIDDSFNFAYILGKAFGNEELQVAGIMGQATAMIFFSAAQLTGTVAGISQLTGFAAFAPAIAIPTAVFSVVSFLNSIGENPNEEVMEALQAFYWKVAAQINFLYDYVGWCNESQQSLMVAGFSKTLEYLKDIQQGFQNSIKYLEFNHNERINHLEDMLKGMWDELRGLGEQNLLLNLRRARHLVEFNKQLSGEQIKSVQDDFEFYLLTESTNPVLTRHITRDNLSEEIFSLPMLKKHLTRNPYDVLGYLNQYQNWLLGHNELTSTIANPYVWLLTAKSYLLFIYNNVDSPSFREITPEQISKLLQPAVNCRELFRRSRKKEFREALFLNIETKKQHLKNYINAVLMNNLEKHFEHSPRFSPLNLVAKYNDSFINDYLGRSDCLSQAAHSHGKIICDPAYFDSLTSKTDYIDIGRSTYILRSTAVDANALNKLIIGNKYGKIRAEFLIAVKLGLGEIDIYLTGKYLEESDIPRLITPIIFRNHAGNEIEIFNIQGYLSREYAKMLHKGNSIEHSARLNTEILQKYFLSLQDAFSGGAELTERIVSKSRGFTLNEGKHYLNRLREQISISIYEARDHFPETYLDPLTEEYAQFKQFRDEINAAYQTENIYTALSGLPLTHLDIMANDEDYKKEVFKQIELAATNSSFVSQNPMELNLEAGINSLNMTVQLLHQRQKSNNAVPPKNDPTLLKLIKNCDAKNIEDAIDNIIDLTGALDLALACPDTRKRNRAVLMLVVEGRAQDSKNPLEIYKILKNLLGKACDIFSEKEFNKLQNAITRFNKYHHINSDTDQDTTSDPLNTCQSNSAHSLRTNPLTNFIDYVYKGFQTASHFVKQNKQQTPHNTFDDGFCEQPPRIDTETGEPIFTCTATKNGDAVGKAQLYGQPILCRSVDGERNNVLEATGVFSKIPQTDEICRALPPTLFDRVWVNSSQAGLLGMLRGGAKFINQSLQKNGWSKPSASFAGQLCYYGSVFSSQYAIEYEQQKESPNVIVHALYQAGIKTGYIAAGEMVLTTIQKMANHLSDKLKQQKCSKLSKLTSCASQLTQCGIFAIHARNGGIVPVVSGIVAGTAAQEVTERILVKNLG